MMTGADPLQLVLALVLPAGLTLAALHWRGRARSLGRQLHEATRVAQEVVVDPAELRCTVCRRRATEHLVQPGGALELCDGSRVISIIYCPAPEDVDPDDDSRLEYES